MMKHRLARKAFAIVAIFGIGGLLVVGISLLLPAQACPAIGAGGPESPPGWAWKQDLYNGCTWTLVNDQDERASDELYRELKVVPPRPVWLYPPRLLGLAAIGCSLVGLVVLISRRHQPRQSTFDGRTPNPSKA